MPGLKVLERAVPCWRRLITKDRVGHHHRIQVRPYLHDDIVFETTGPTVVIGEPRPHWSSTLSEAQRWLCPRRHADA
jgi:hypothetical protein